MESRFNRGKQEQEMNDQDGHQISFAEAYSNAKDWGKDFRTLINHKPIENLDIENLEQALLDTQLTSSNIGYRLLQKMRWKAEALARISKDTLGLGDDDNDINDDDVDGGDDDEDVGNKF